MGFLSGLIKRKPVTDEVLRSMENLEPITINLHNQQIQCTDGRWCGSENLEVAGRTAEQEEVHRLRREKVALEREIIKFARQEEEMKQLREKLNLMDLKYRVLVEMVATNKVGQVETLPERCAMRSERRCK